MVAPDLVSTQESDPQNHNGAPSKAVLIIAAQMLFYSKKFQDPAFRQLFQMYYETPSMLAGKTTDGIDGFLDDEKKSLQGMASGQMDEVLSSGSQEPF